MKTTPTLTSIVEARCPFIDGRFVSGTETFFVRDPATGDVMTEVDGCSFEQFDDAVAAARGAFDQGPWPQMRRVERAGFLHRFADALERRREALVETVIMETGCPRSLAEASVISAVDNSRELVDLGFGLGSVSADSGEPEIRQRGRHFTIAERLYKFTPAEASEC